MGVLSGAYNGSFGGVSFFEISSGGGLAGAPLDELGTAYHIPFTDSNEEINTGNGPREWEILVGVEAAQLSSLEGKVGDSGTLVWHRGSWSSVRLRGLGPSEKTLGFDAYKVSLKLRKL